MYLAGERVEAEQSHGVAKHVTPLFVMSRLSLAELRLQLMLQEGETRKVKRAKSLGPKRSLLGLEWIVILYIYILYISFKFGLNYHRETSQRTRGRRKKGRTLWLGVSLLNTNECVSHEG